MVNLECNIILFIMSLHDKKFKCMKEKIHCKQIRFPKCETEAYLGQVRLSHSMSVVNHLEQNSQNGLNTADTEIIRISF